MKGGRIQFYEEVVHCSKGIRSGDQQWEDRDHRLLRQVKKKCREPINPWREGRRSLFRGPSETTGRQTNLRSRTASVVGNGKLSERKGKCTLPETNAKRESPLVPLIGKICDGLERIWLQAGKEEKKVENDAEKKSATGRVSRNPCVRSNKLQQTKGERKKNIEVARTRTI